MWSEFFESSLHLQRYLYLGICIVILILATCFNSIGREFFIVYWKKIKPNIGQIIAESVIVAEGVVNFLINVIKDIFKNKGNK